MELYKFGVEYAKQRDLILVDTKYEFGKDSEGNIILVIGSIGLSKSGVFCKL